jgi:D-alanine-D-alanine ligase-like ATP-grasp enzyme
MASNFSLSNGDISTIKSSVDVNALRPSGTEPSFIKNGNKVSDVKKIIIVYSYVKREFFPTEQQYITEKDAQVDGERIAKEVQKLGIDCIALPADDYMVEKVKDYNPDMVINLVDSIKGKEYLTATVPGMLDILGYPFTGAGLLGLAVCYNKFLTKKLLQSAGIPVPNFQLFHNHTDKLDINLRFPLISKLNEIHGAVEITRDSISEDEKHLKERLKYLIKTYDQPVLVEEYIAGREITGYVLQGTNTKVYLAEKVFNKPDEKYVFATFEDQWEEKSSTNKLDDVYYYTKYEDTLLKDYVARAFEITDMLDYGKFDIRMDASGRYYFIDSNANPAFGPKETETAMGLILQDIYGIPFLEILKRIIINTTGMSEDEYTSSTGGGSNVISSELSQSTN